MEFIVNVYKDGRYVASLNAFNTCAEARKFIEENTDKLCDEGYYYVIDMKFDDINILNVFLMAEFDNSRFNNKN